MYESPIKIIAGKIQTQIDDEIYRAVQNVGINVDREELLKALEYDRGQYKKGFDDGTAGMHELNNLKKTGRHIDIDSFLKQIGGEE